MPWGQGMSIICGAHHKQAPNWRGTCIQSSLLTEALHCFAFCMCFLFVPCTPSAVYAKFTQHSELRDILLATGHAKLVLNNTHSFKEELDQIQPEAYAPIPVGFRAWALGHSMYWTQLPPNPPLFLARTIRNKFCF